MKRSRIIFNKIVRTLHRWLGLATGLVVMVVSLAGALMAFEPQLCWVGVPKATHAETMQVGNILKAGQRQYPGRGLRVGLNRDLTLPAEVMVIEGAPEAERGLTWRSEMRLWETSFLHPTTGQVLARRDNRYSFFPVVEAMHTNLLLRRPFGQQVVAWSVVVFVVIGITGFVLWLPQRWRYLRQRLTIKWEARPRRRNYDLHVVLGFYVLAFAFWFQATGLMWSFRPWRNAVFTLVGKVTPSVPRRPLATPKAAFSLADAIAQAQAQNPNWTAIWFGLPASDTARCEITVSLKDGLIYLARNQYEYRPASHLLLSGPRFQEQSVGKKLQASNLYLHTGRSLGLPGQVLAFLAALVCASLPLTGFLIWKK